MNIFYRYYIEVVTKKYVDFGGRASRSEFWFFLLFYTLFASVAFSLDVALYFYDLTPQFFTDLLAQSGSENDLTIIGTIYMLLMFIPSIAITVRRLHDQGKSGWWFLIILIPLIGFFAMIYFGIKESQDGDNKYGPNPQTQMSKERTPPTSKSSDVQDLELKPKSGKMIKILGIFLLVIFIIAGSLFFFMGGTIIAFVKSIQAELNQPVTSEITSSKGIVTIRVPLSKQYSLTYPNLPLCTPDKEKQNGAFSRIIADGYSTNYSCVNDQCELSIDIENPDKYPKTIEVYRQNQSGECKKTRLNMNKPTLSGYTAVVEMTPELLSKLEITTQEYEATPQETKNYTSWQVMGTKKIQFHYDDLINTDTLLIDGKPRATIIFDKQENGEKKEEKGSTNIELNKDLQLIEDEIKKLKEKRSDLMNRLQ